jgi:hypothetical protein
MHCIALHCVGLGLVGLHRRRKVTKAQHNTTGQDTIFILHVHVHPSSPSFVHLLHVSYSMLRRRGRCSGPTGPLRRPRPPYHTIDGTRLSHPFLELACTVQHSAASPSPRFRIEGAMHGEGVRADFCAVIHSPGWDSGTLGLWNHQPGILRPAEAIRREKKTEEVLGRHSAIALIRSVSSVSSVSSVR